MTLDMNILPIAVAAGEAGVAESLFTSRAREKKRPFIKELEPKVRGVV